MILISVERRRHLVKLLLDHGANVNAQISGEKDRQKGYTPLHIAVFQADESLFKLLLSRGADFTIKDARKETPLDVAKTFEGYAIKAQNEDEKHICKSYRFTGAVKTLSRSINIYFAPNAIPK